MKSTDDVEIVARFQERFGQGAAFARAKQFMAEYLSLSDSSLSPVARQALQVAKAFNTGQGSTADLAEMRVRCWKYLGTQDEEHQKSDRPAVRAVIFLLGDAPSAGEEIDYMVEVFVGFADEVENHSDQLIPLLQQHFSRS